MTFADQVLYHVRRAEFKAIETILDDDTFWADQKRLWLEEIGDDAREIFDAGAAAARKVKLYRPPRKGLRGLRDRVFPRTKANFLEPDESVVLDVADQVFATYTDEWWAQLEKTTRDGLRAAITRAAEEGTGVPGVISDITPLFGQARAERIGVTETTRLFGRGAQATYKASEIATWIWQTVEDDDVDEECQLLDGQEFPIDVDFDPAHVNCRCFPLAVQPDQSDQSDQSDEVDEG